MLAVCILTPNESAELAADAGLCSWCREPLGGDIAVGLDFTACHAACLFRQLVGSVGHQMKACPCFGGDVCDPPNVSKRVAAEMAAAFWYQMHKGEILRRMA